MAWLGECLRRKGPDGVDLAGFGALNWDRLLQVPSLQEPDTEYSPVEIAALGGSAANSIFAAARLGLSTAYIGAVGDDRPGAQLIGDFEAAGVRTDAIAVKRERATGEAICVTDQYGRRLILVQPGANSLLDRDDLERAVGFVHTWRPSVVHLSSFVDKEQLALQLEFAQELRLNAPDVILTCSPGSIYVRMEMENAARVRELLSFCRLLFFNRLEVTKLAGYPKPQYERAANHMLAEFPRCDAVVVTLGRGRSGRNSTLGMEQLSIASTTGAEDEVHQPSSVVVRREEIVRVPKSESIGKVVDTTGAGDAYAGGFLFGLTSGLSVDECALAGHVVAQHSVLGIGARESLPTPESFERTFSRLGRRAIA